MDKRNTVYILAYFPFDTFLNLSVSYFKFIGKMKTVQTLMLLVDADIVYEYFDFLLEKEEVAGLTIEDNPLLVLYKLK